MTYNGSVTLPSDATVVDDAIRFVSERSKENLEPLGNSNDDDKEESEEPDYNEDQDQLEEEEQEERQEKWHHQRRIRFSEPICIYFYHLNIHKKA